MKVTSPQRRREALPLQAPDGLEAFRLKADPKLAILSWPTSATARRSVESLTQAESEVLDAMCAGLSNAEIAVRRGRSSRTIANQVASIFVKLGVSGRPELFAKLARRRRGP